MDLISLSLAKKYTDDMTDGIKMIFQQPVSTFNNMTTSYPSPQKGWVVQTLDSGNFYRYDGSVWQYIQQINNNQMTDLRTKMGVLSSLQTTEKGTLVGALNEIKLKVSDTAPTDGSLLWVDTTVN